MVPRCSEPSSPYDTQEEAWTPQAQLVRDGFAIALASLTAAAYEAKRNSMISGGMGDMYVYIHVFVLPHLRDPIKAGVGWKILWKN